jgi:hypothetical protein
MSEKAVSDDLEALIFKIFLARRQTMVAPREIGNQQILIEWPIFFS